jgi:hypothetical protein
VTDAEVLASILRRAKAPMWWARLSYPENPKFWNADERRVLADVFGR